MARYFAFVLVLLVVAPESRADFDLSSDFSTTQNPNGAWAYGMKDSTFSAFIQTSQLSIAGGRMVGWGDPSVFPFVLKNVSGSTVIDGTTTYQTNAVALHPSSTGAHAVVRWTAPTAGLYSVESMFSDIENDSPATVDVHILRNNTSIFSSDLSAGVLSSNFADSFTLNSGDTIDFQVGFGGNGFSFDHTQLAINITAVPEPSSLMLLSAVGFMAGLRCRSRKLGKFNH